MPRYPAWMSIEIRAEWRRYINANHRCNATYRAKIAGEKGYDKRQARKAALAVRRARTQESA